MQQLLLISIFFISSTYSIAIKSECIDKGKLRYTSNGQIINKTEAICFNVPIMKIMSKKCLKKCNAVVNYKLFKPDKPIYGPIGSPLHKKCIFVGGKPKIVSFYNGKKWIKTSICRFKDESFISVFNLI